jgi:hypothetical protein
MGWKKENTFETVDKVLQALGAQQALNIYLSKIELFIPYGFSTQSLYLSVVKFVVYYFA